MFFIIKCREAVNEAELLNTTFYM